MTGIERQLVRRGNATTAEPRGRSKRARSASHRTDGSRARGFGDGAGESREVRVVVLRSNTVFESYCTDWFMPNLESQPAAGRPMDSGTGHDRGEAA